MILIGELLEVVERNKAYLKEEKQMSYLRFLQKKLRLSFN